MSYLCKITTSRAPAASQITCSSSVVFLFPLQNSWGVGSLLSSCTCSTSHAPATIWFACFQFLSSMSHFKARDNEIVGGGIGCQIQSLQFYPSHFLPQNSGKCNCRGWGVIFVQNYNISCTCGKSNYIFFLCRFPFPTSKLEKM